MKIIDILNKIANGEEPPKKIEYRNEEWEYDKEEKDYRYVFLKEVNWLFDENIITEILNDEVEILETTITYKQDNIENNKKDKIEKMGISYMKEVVEGGWATEYFSESERKIINKINEIIDHINKEV